MMFLPSDNFYITKETMTIKNIQLTDAGYIICLAKNSYGSFMKYYNVIVHPENSL